MVFNEVIIPMIDVNDQLAIIEKVYFKNGGYVEIYDTIFSVSTSKVIKDYACEYNGYIVYLIKELDEVAAGSVIALIYEDKEDALTKTKELKELEETNDNKTPTNASKKAIKYADSIGFDLNQITQNKVIKVKDIKDFIDKKITT